LLQIRRIVRRCDPAPSDIRASPRPFDGQGHGGRRGDLAGILLRGRWSFDECGLSLRSQVRGATYKVACAATNLLRKGNPPQSYACNMDPKVTGGEPYVLETNPSDADAVPEKRHSLTGDVFVHDHGADTDLRRILSTRHLTMIAVG
jgi:hypothetical protein